MTIDELKAKLTASLEHHNSMADQLDYKRDPHAVGWHRGIVGGLVLARYLIDQLEWQDRNTTKPPEGR